MEGELDERGDIVLGQSGVSDEEWGQRVGVLGIDGRVVGVMEEW